MEKIRGKGGDGDLTDAGALVRVLDFSDRVGCMYDRPLAQLTTVFSKGFPPLAALISHSVLPKRDRRHLRQVKALRGVSKANLSHTHTYTHTQKKGRGGADVISGTQQTASLVQHLELPYSSVRWCMVYQGAAWTGGR